MASPDPPTPYAVPRKPGPGQPWSDLETRHLIEAYEERWYALKRGPLKAQQWEDVAAEVAARCGAASLSKTGTQCRHKMEKLRKRYRAEQKLPAPSRWVHFERMEQMERGPLPVFSRPPRAGRYPGKSESFDDGDDAEVDESEEEEDEDEEVEEEDRVNGNIRSINGLLGGENLRFLGVPAKSAFRGEEGEEVKGGVARELANTVKRFGEQFERLEKRRMQLTRELEKERMMTEAKKMDMLIESQQYLVDAIARASHSAKKARRSVEA